MSEKDNGGPAFPHLRRYVGPDTYESLSEGGMTLRDWFAGQALVTVTRTWPPVSHDNYAAIVARQAYAIADEMMEARK